MGRILLTVSAVLLAAGAAGAEEPAPEGDKQLSGMSIVGDHEAPKSLVIVPWKSALPAATLDVSRALDDGRQPVDRDVFLRELSYYQLREASTHVSSPGSK